MATHGARIGYRGPLHQIHSSDHASALRIPREISDNIARELELGRIQKVTALPPAYILSPLGAVQKKLYRQFEGWRRIHDLWLPFGLSTAPFIFNYFSEGLHRILS